MRRLIGLIAFVALLGVALLLLRAPRPTVSSSGDADAEHSTPGFGASTQGSTGTGPTPGERKSAPGLVATAGPTSRRATSLEAPPGAEAAAAEQPFVFLIDGLPCPSFRIAVVAQGHEAAEVVHASALHARLEEGLGGSVAFATDQISASAARWSGFVPMAELAQQGFTLHALPRPTVRGVVVAADSGEPIEGASVVARSSEAALAWLLGDSYEASTTSSADGRFVLQLLASGSHRIEGHSPRHLSHAHECDVLTDTDIGAALVLVPRPVLQVTLAGADGDPASHYAAHTLLGTRVPFARDWTAAVPLDPDVEFLDIAVGLPGEIEITTFFAGRASDHPDGVTIELGAAALDISVIGAPLDEQRLAALVFTTLPSGAEVLLSSWITVGETVRVPLVAAGDVAVDVVWKNADNSPRTLVRRRVEAAPGRVTPVTIELPKRLQRIQLAGADGRPILVGEVWFATGAEGQLTAPGGKLDAEGKQLVPDLDRTPLWLHGVATEAEVPFAGVRLDPRSAEDMLATITLGAVVRTEVELVPSGGSPLPSDYFAEVVCAQTGQMANYYSVPATGRLTLSWFQASDAALALPAGTTWAPRAPVPLTAGSLRVPVVLRAWCSIDTGTAALVELEHVESGLTLAELERDTTVRREPFAGGERWWGVPAGHYRVTFAGDEEPRGPFAVAPGAWVTVPAARAR